MSRQRRKKGNRESIRAANAEVEVQLSAKRIGAFRAASRARPQPAASLANFISTSDIQITDIVSRWRQAQFAEHQRRRMRMCASSDMHRADDATCIYDMIVVHKFVTANPLELRWCSVTASFSLEFTRCYLRLQKRSR